MPTFNTFLDSAHPFHFIVYKGLALKTQELHASHADLTKAQNALHMAAPIWSRSVLQLTQYVMRHLSHQMINSLSVYRPRDLEFLPGL